jgi:hypothetical protein
VQLNKKLMAKVVAATPLVGVEGYSEVVLNAMRATPEAHVVYLEGT